MIDSKQLRDLVEAVYRDRSEWWLSRYGTQWLDHISVANVLEFAQCAMVGINEKTSGCRETLFSAIKDAFGAEQERRWGRFI